MANERNTTLYTGTTNNLEARVCQHKTKQIDGFTKRYNINKLVFFDTFHSPQEAIAAEKKIKGWARDKKIDLIKKENSNFEDLSKDW
jgi:putative endonuclease